MTIYIIRTGFHIHTSDPYDDVKVNSWMGDLDLFFQGQSQ